MQVVKIVCVKKYAAITFHYETLYDNVFSCSPRGITNKYTKAKGLRLGVWSGPITNQINVMAALFIIIKIFTYKNVDMVRGICISLEKLGLGKLINIFKG